MLFGGFVIIWVVFRKLDYDLLVQRNENMEIGVESSSPEETPSRESFDGKTVTCLSDVIMDIQEETLHVSSSDPVDAAAAQPPSNKASSDAHDTVAMETDEPPSTSSENVECSSDPTGEQASR